LILLGLTVLFGADFAGNLAEQARELGDCPHAKVEAFRETSSGIGFDGWAILSCGDKKRLAVVTGEGMAWAPLPASPELTMHGFIELKSTFRGVQRVGEQFRLSAGPHGMKRPGMVLTVCAKGREQLVLIEPHPLRTVLNTVVREKGVERAHIEIHGLDEPPHIQEHPVGGNRIDHPMP
jgi:hypothetical protein